MFPSPPCGFVDTKVNPGQTYNYFAQNVSPTGTSISSNTATVTVPGATGFTTIRIKPNAAQTDSQGNVWSIDTPFVIGGSADVTTTHAITGAKPAASDTKLYTGERWGASTYKFLAPPGTYAITHKFVEASFSAAGKRIFSVTANGTVILPNFDIYAKCKEYVACDQTVNFVNTLNTITLQFVVGSADQPTIEGIQIEAVSITPPPPPHGPISLSCDPVSVICTSAGIIVGDKWSDTLTVDTADGQHLSVAQTGVK